MAPPVPVLSAVTAISVLSAEPTSFADPRHPLAFLRRGEGIVGVGEALRLEFTGPERLREAARRWREVVARAHVVDEVHRAGSGLVAFGSFAFADDSPETSVLVVPRLVLGRRGGVEWMTRVTVDGEAPPEPAPAPSGDYFSVTLREGALGAAGYVAAVAEAVRRIDAGELSKVVLARDLVGELPEGADLRRLVDALALAYPDTFTYAVDGRIGSSPETLVSVHERTVTARVLAGSARRGVDAADDAALSTALVTSTKDLDEHGYALRSVLAALRPLSPGVAASESPFLLRLPNLWHLASDVEGVLTAGASALDLIATLHPTAAVAGSPSARALELIAELEPGDRGHYAGPVGWVDGDGDGEWAVALRGAHVARDGAIRAFAGAGIVAESVPERELAETSLKFRPIVEALR